MATVKNVLDSQMANVKAGRESIARPPFEQVDELADGLVAEYKNPNFRGWYCGVINKYGVSRVLEWHRRAIEGKSPGRLFTVYVNQAGGYKKVDSHGKNH